MSVKVVRGYSGNVLDQVPELATKRKRVFKRYVYALVEGCAGKDTESPAEATILFLFVARTTKWSTGLLTGLHFHSE
jgi:hypothetical protein